MNALEINKLIKTRLIHDSLYDDIQSVLDGLNKELLRLSSEAQETMRSEITRVVSVGGKRLRPILAFLCYRMGKGNTLDILPLMCMLELMHTTSLIHDDVVDNASLRRGQPTINSTNGISRAVQSGDFLLAKTMEYLHIYRGTGINEALTNVSVEMCLGELQQQRTRFDVRSQTKELYFVQVYRKTASLLAASCFTGALAGGMAESEAKKLREYGEKLGIAFQLRDDLLDYSDTSSFGKTVGQDLRSGIFTLPVIELLDRRGIPDSVRIQLEKHNKNEHEMRQLINFVKESGVLQLTEAVVREKSFEAIDALRDFPKCSERDALVELAERLAGRQA